MILLLVFLSVCEWVCVMTSVCRMVVMLHFVVLFGFHSLGYFSRVKFGVEIFNNNVRVYK